MHVEDADHLADEWRKAGVEVTGPEDFDWGKREGRHTDPDGDLIRFRIAATTLETPGLASERGDRGMRECAGMSLERAVKGV